MIHTVYLNDEYDNVQKLLKEIRRYEQGVRIESPNANNVAPEGYMTSEEFRKRAAVKVNTFCNKHGIL